jgi:hypothetical protein
MSVEPAIRSFVSAKGPSMTVRFHPGALDRRFPNPAVADGEIEVRQLFELGDFAPSEAVERFRKIEIVAKK